MYELTLAEVRQQVPSIHVYGRGKVTVLTPQPIDARYEVRHYSDGFTEGQGTKECPFDYLSAAPVSPHYAVIDLWFKFQSHAAKTSVFIKVNDWILQVETDGVRAEDGHFTRLRPA